MPTLILVRHGRTQANAQGILAGRSPGVHLDDTGREEADNVAARLAGLPLAEVVTSPLERTRETAQRIVRAHPSLSRVRRDKGLIECGYGAWTGQAIKDLAREPLWKTVQAHPSAVRFPEGESMLEMQGRAVSCVRTWDGRIAEEHGTDACWVAVSHGDVIKSVLADAMGMHLDHFQRLVVAPASVSVVHYAAERPVVVRVNDSGSDLASLAPKRQNKRKRRTRSSGDAVVGGGT